MNRKLTFLLLAFLLATSLTLHAQQAILGFDSTYAISFTDTVQQNDTASFRVRFKNYGLVSISDTFFVYSAYKNSQNIVMGVHKETIFPAGPFLLAPGDTVSTRAIIYYDAQRFALGIDVVVIWPVVNGALTLDSIEFQTFVYSLSQVAELLNANGVNVFPNPCSDKLNIASPKAMAQITIYDAAGKVVLSQSQNETIDLSQLKDAVYMVELKYKSGTRKLIKVQKKNN